MTQPAILAIVLAAGEGTRMRSSLPKVMHGVANRPMLAHVMEAARSLPGAALAVVVGPGMERVTALARAAGAETFVQQERLGTAHAMLAARAVLETGADRVLVLFGDTPLVRPETLTRISDALGEGADLAVLGFHAVDPTGYGRLVTRDGRLQAIREEKDASAEERAITFCNAGIMGFAGRHLPALLDAIGNDNAKGEFYLTDAVEIAAGKGLRVVALEGEEQEVLGVNTRAQLAQAEAALQQRLRAAAMAGGATLIAPETVFLSADTVLGADVIVEPHVVFGAGVTVEEGAVIHAFSHLEGATVGRYANVGPFARLRPGADLGESAKVGNFVEVKASLIEAGAKVSHLSYIGDATVGAEANVGAGTITCNYDGFFKHRTEIGAGAFIGSNSALVAPVRIGEGAYVGSGSVVTEDVPADALALARGRQSVRPGWAAAYRRAMQAAKAKAKAKTGA